MNLHNELQNEKITCILVNTKRTWYARGGGGGMINKQMDASEAVYIRGNVLDIV